ncbi:MULTISPECIES: hypothetical protein [unclassified Synechocystis]|uniref:hypothetical protein n=1 Tax=unclassified Synechocystis TaxID=2640012 RepID=UPI00041FB9EF|nr:MULTISPECIES: hypothetical protein [unclassified Synechocystis]AIE73536.1 hypothetical protein D082_10080 [Synechocystis sp. PCC 6714]MCT0254125.1 hypothetical protein [Synechocystis sp. CS-94]
MSSYHLRLEGDTLYGAFNRAEPASGDCLVMDAAHGIDAMIQQGVLAGGNLLKIEGPQSVAVAYTLAQRLAPLYGAIAIMDPKACRRGYKVYIVAIRRVKEYPLGSLIEAPIKVSQQISRQIKVAICGFPQVGKSCLIEGIRQVISSQVGAPYPYVIRACPDGEGAWLHQTQVNNPPLAEDLRSQNRGHWSPAFAAMAAGWVRSANETINLTDTGGQPSPENRLIMAEATHGIIIYKTEAEQQQWLEFCQSLPLPIIAMVESRLGHADDKVNLGETITGIVYGLSRGDTQLRDKLMVQALGQRLIELTVHIPPP